MKKWALYWTEGTYEKEEIKFLDETTISQVVNEENGFEPEEIEQIIGLKLSDYYQENQIIGEGLIVIRVDDMLEAEVIKKLTDFFKQDKIDLKSLSDFMHS